MVALIASASSSSHGDADAAGGLPLRAVRDVRLLSRTTRFDYQNIDPTARRLYLAHLVDSTIVVVDLDHLQPIATIRHVADVHGVLGVPELHRVFATATGTNQLVAIDATTNHIIARARTGSFPDGLTYGVAPFCWTPDPWGCPGQGSVRNLVDRGGHLPGWFRAIA